MGKIYIDSFFVECAIRNFYRVYSEVYPDREFEGFSLKSLVTGTLRSLFDEKQASEWDVIMPTTFDEYPSIANCDIDLEPFSCEWGEVRSVKTPEVYLLRMELEDMVFEDAKLDTKLILLLGSTRPDFIKFENYCGQPNGVLQQRGGVFWIRDREQPYPNMPALPWKDYVFPFGYASGLEDHEI